MEHEEGRAPADLLVDLERLDRKVEILVHALVEANHVLLEALHLLPPLADPAARATARAGRAWRPAWSASLVEQVRDATPMARDGDQRWKGVRRPRRRALPRKEECAVGLGRLRDVDLLFGYRHAPAKP